MATVTNIRSISNPNQSVTEYTGNGVKTVIHGPVWEGEHASPQGGYYDKPHPMSFLDGEGVRRMPLAYD